jgi:hypothetical protein
VSKLNPPDEYGLDGNYEPVCPYCGLGHDGEHQRGADAGKAQAEGWVSVEERLPEEGVSVIVDGGSAYLSSSGEWRTASGNHREIQWKVTHWMPIPALPSPPAEASQLPAGETEEQRPACGVCGNPDAWPQSVGPRCAEHLVITPPTEPK